MTRSKCSPRSASAGTISAAFPRRPTDSASRLRAASRHQRDRFVERLGGAIEIPSLEPALDPRRIDLDTEDRRSGHRPGQRLGAAHPAEARSQDRPAGEIRGAEMLLARRPERLVGALQDSLRPDVDPASGGHLAVHRETLGLEPAELVPGRPLRHEQRVRDQHARRPGMRPQHADGLAALYEQRLVLAEREQRAHDRAQRLVVARRLPRAAVDDQLLRVLGDLRIEVVEQHAERRLGRPRSRVELGPTRRADVRKVAAERLHGLLDGVDRRHEASCSR